MEKNSLHKLLERYASDQCTEEERQLVEYWYELLGEPIDMDLSEEEWLALEARIWKQLQPVSASDSRERYRRPLWKTVTIAVSGIAALFVIVFGISWYRDRPSGENILVQAGEQKMWTQYRNDDGQVKIIRLPDSSEVALEPNSGLAVSNGFNQKNREVRLVGEAAFDVRRNPGIPFIVYAGGMATKVLGTRFRVRAAKPGQPIEVDVQSGKVTVYRQTSDRRGEGPVNNGLILTSNQKATYFPESEQFIAGLTDKPEPTRSLLSPAGGQDSFVFDETPVSDILRQLEEVYATEIELEQENLGNCPFTGNLTHQSLFTQLELLCGAINGKYEIRGTKILITGKGCL